MQLSGSWRWGRRRRSWTLFAALLLLLRYRYGRDGASIVVLGGIVLDHAVLLGLAAWDFTETGAVSPFTVAIPALLVYAFTLGAATPSASTRGRSVGFSPRAAQPGRPATRCAPLPPR
jgi:hypothetical protein